MCYPVKLERSYINLKITFLPLFTLQNNGWLILFFNGYRFSIFFTTSQVAWPGPIMLDKKKMGIFPPSKLIIEFHLMERFRFQLTQIFYEYNEQLSLYTVMYSNTCLDRHNAFQMSPLFSLKRKKKRKKNKERSRHRFSHDINLCALVY